MLAQDHSHDLIRQNIEDLMNVEVTTASKKEQKLSETEALRMVPGSARNDL